MELLDDKTFSKIKGRVDQIVSAQANVKKMFKSLADMFWISETDVGAGNSSMTVHYNTDAWGNDDIRLTATTTSRDQVTGMHRLIKTSKPKFSVKCKDKNYANKIEHALDKWWEASNARMRVKNESELALSGILWSDMNLAVTAVDDLIDVLETKIEDPELKIRKNRLKKLRKKTPFIFEPESGLEAYPVWGEDGKSEHLTVTNMTGRILKERWGTNVDDDDGSYNVYDYWNLAYHCVGYGTSAMDKQIMGGLHDLPDIPRFSAVADGTDLFSDEMKKRNPFLYGKWKSNIHKREDELMTILASSTFARGPGPLILRDKSEPTYQKDDIEVHYEGLVRVMSMSGKPQFVDDHVYDRNLLELQGLYGNMGESTTISGQTLGESIEKYTAYSGYMAASRAGRLPIIDIEEAEKKVIHDAAIYALEYFKERNMKWEGLKPDDILDDFELEVKLEVDLPQDKVQAAQALAQLSNLNVPISTEWIHNELQIRDSQKMVNDWMSEQARMEAFKADLPNMLPQMLSMMQNMAQPQEMPQGMPPEAPINTANPAQPMGPAGSMAGAEIPPGQQPIPPEVTGGRPNVQPG